MPDSTAVSAPTRFRGHRHAEGVVAWIGAALHLPGFSHEHGDTDSVVVLAKTNHYWQEHLRATG